MRKFLGLAIGVSIVLGASQAMATTYAEFKHQVVIDAETLLYASGRGKFAIPAVLGAAKTMSKPGGLLTVDGIEEGMAWARNYCRRIEDGSVSQKQLAEASLTSVNRGLDEIESDKSGKYASLPVADQAAISALAISFNYNAVVITCPNYLKPKP